LAFSIRAATLDAMKQSLDHLPEGKQRELEFVVGVIREGFAKAVAHRTAARFRVGKLLKIILFGSYARGDWVDDPMARKAKVRAFAAVLMLSACASNGSVRYLLITDTYHGPIVWHKFLTLEACEQASQERPPDFTTRCTSSRDLRGR
jgi:hypothetical protein